MIFRVSGHDWARRSSPSVFWAPLSLENCLIKGGIPGRLWSGEHRLALFALFLHNISDSPHDISIPRWLHIFLLWPNTKQKQPSGVVALFWLRFPEASVHSHLSVCSWAFPWSMEASLWQKCVEEETVCVMASRNQTEKGTRHNLTGHTPNDLLPPARPYFLKLPKAPKIAPAVGESNIQQTHLWKPVHIRTTTAAWNSNC